MPVTKFKLCMTYLQFVSVNECLNYKRGINLCFIVLKLAVCVFICHIPSFILCWFRCNLWLYLSISLCLFTLLHLLSNTNVFLYNNVKKQSSVWATWSHKAVLMSISLVQTPGSCITWCACLLPTFQWYSLHLSRMAGGVDLGGWLHTEMVYPPTDGYLSQYSPGPM